MLKQNVLEEMSAIAGQGNTKISWGCYLLPAKSIERLHSSDVNLLKLN